MTDSRITLADGMMQIPVELYIVHCLAIDDSRKLLEQLEGCGDVEFQANILESVVRLLLRTFPDYLRTDTSPPEFAPPSNE